MQNQSLEDAKILIGAARSTIELLTSSPGFKSEIIKRSIPTDRFKEKAGIVLRLKHYHTGELRGEMQLPFPEHELKDIIVDATVHAASKDHRFPPLTKKEADETTIELSIITKHSLLKGGEAKRLAAFKKGREGIMVVYGVHRGLIMPNEIASKEWSKKEIFEEACTLAHLPKEYWNQPNVRVYSFEAKSFIEEIPNGKVIEEVAKSDSTK